MVLMKVFLLNLTVFTATLYAQRYITCTNPQNLNACGQLNRSEDIQCLLRKNSVDCLLLVDSGDVTFTSVSAEEGFLASSLTNNLVVLGEFVDQNSKTLSEYETAILVRNNLGNGFTSLKGAKFCHPGIDIMQTSPMILKQFETEILKQNNIQGCSENGKTVTENYISALHEFFGPSCRPGKWSIVNNTFDTELKQRYTKLMQLCNSNTYLENPQDPFLQSLNCLLNGDGDVALTTINKIQDHIATRPEILTNYTLLCQNGTNVNVTEGCAWTRQPGHLLIGNKEKVTNLPRELQVWFNSFLYNSTTVIELPIENTDILSLSEKYVQVLKELLFPNQLHLINVLTNPPALETFIKERRTIPTSETARLCKSSVNICTTTTDEERKCKWLQQAALNYGLQPVIYCAPKPGKEECLNALQRLTVDVAISDENTMYIANRKNLSIIALGEEERRYMNRTVLVVDTTINITSLDDLRNKKGCFSEYGDVAWLAFTDLLRQKFWPTPKEYPVELSQFLNDSCMPGIEDRETWTVGISFEQLCEICEASNYDSPTRRTCKPDYTNDFYGSEGALKCLQNRGDFAVLTLLDNLVLPTNTSIMCRNGTLANANATIDNDCALSVTANDVIVVRKSESKKRDIELLLQEIDERFAAQTHTPFKVFDRFATLRDLMFADHTIGLEITSASTNKYIKAQMELFTNIPEIKTTTTNPGDGDSASKIQSNLFLYTALFLVFIYTYF